MIVTELEAWFMTPSDLAQENAELRQLLGAALEQLKAAGVDTFKLPPRTTARLVESVTPPNQTHQAGGR